MVMMTRDEKKAWLDRYRDRMRKAKLLEEELREARAAALPGSPGLDGMPRGQGGGSIVERAVIDIDRVDGELRAVLADAAQAWAEIQAVIAGLPAPEYGIMRMRHLSPSWWSVPSWQTIANRVYLSEGRAKHLYGETLDRLQIG